MNTRVIGPGTITSFPGTATPEVPADWDFDKSVDVMATRMRTWKSLTAEILSELYVAREALSKPHSNNSGWADYCKAIGVEKRTANRWLRRARMGQLSHAEEAHENYPKAIFTGENEWYTPTESIEAARVTCLVTSTSTQRHPPQRSGKCRLQNSSTRTMTG